MFPKILFIGRLLLNVKAATSHYNTYSTALTPWGQRNLELDSAISMTPGIQHYLIRTILKP